MSFVKKNILQKYAQSGFMLLLIGVLAAYTSTSLDYNWQWYRVEQFLFTIKDGIFTKGLLFDGLQITIKISLISLFFSVVIGFTTSLVRFSASPVLNGLVLVYVESIRNTPLLIQLFVIYFVIAPVINLSPFASAVAALSLFEGAYASEIIRTGILSVSTEQWEAARSLGLSRPQTFRHIILPQAMKQISPMLAGQGVSLIKDSSLVSTISICDLTMRGQSIVADTFLTFEIWFTVALCYFVLTASLSTGISIWERRLLLKG